MRADSALSHLKDEEICIVRLAEGEREMRWSRADWRFYYMEGNERLVCPFEEIYEWRPASIRFTP
jgi:hypothetical protein